MGDPLAPAGVALRVEGLDKVIEHIAPILVAAGRTQAAAEIRAMEIDNWTDDSIGTRNRAAKIAEGSSGGSD